MTRPPKFAVAFGDQFDEDVCRSTVYHQIGGRFMKPAIISLHDYRSFIKQKLRSAEIHIAACPDSLYRIYKVFLNLDLADVDRIMQTKYSLCGPPPRQPSAMLRSMLLMVLLHVTRFTVWVDMMRTTPIYAIISGFDPFYVPGASTFYDFMYRMWDGTSKDLSPHVKPMPVKVKKPKGKGKKAESVEPESVDNLILRLMGQRFGLDTEAYATLFRIFKSCFLDVSVSKGLVTPEQIETAGDGTPVVTAARFRHHRTCDCAEKGIPNCTCDRYFSQSDTNVGWDSSRGMFYVGYDMYVLTEARSELPLFCHLNYASKHDSHGFCEAFFRFLALFPELKPSSLLLDSAHDSMAIYRLCQGLHITPYIDLNLCNTKKTSDYHGVVLGPDGIPICSAGLKMKTNGNDLHRQYAKFRCPMMKKGGCTCPCPCTNATFGRTCSIPMKTNIRLYTDPPRESQEWKSMYNRRTASERVNKRMKGDFLLEHVRHRHTCFWYARVYLIMMAVHLSSWSLYS